MIDLLKVNQKLRAGVALRQAWEGVDDDMTSTAAPAVADGPPEPWHMTVAAAQLSWHQVRVCLSSEKAREGSGIADFQQHIACSSRQHVGSSICCHLWSL